MTQEKCEHTGKASFSSTLFDQNTFHSNKYLYIISHINIYIQILTFYLDVHKNKSRSS